MRTRLFLLWKIFPKCIHCIHYQKECTGVFFIKIPENFVCDSFENKGLCHTCKNEKICGYKKQYPNSELDICDEYSHERDD